MSIENVAGGALAGNRPASTGKGGRGSLRSQGNRAIAERGKVLPHEKTLTRFSNCRTGAKTRIFRSFPLISAIPVISFSYELTADWCDGR